MSDPQHSSGDLRLTPQNPWPGLAAFTPENHDFFCGRANEIAEISRRVRRQMLTVLFGVSGLGKTSLLQAGLLPKLGGTQFYPILVGLDHRPESDDLCEQVRAAINREVPHAIAAGMVVPRGPLPGEDLWGYFHDRTIDWHNARGELIYPVLVFDQFEEIFTREMLTRAMEERRDRFIELLACLVENRAPDSLTREVDRNADLANRIDFRQDDYRIVISLREDFLAHLESFKWRMPSVMENRMRLAPMSEEQALQVVLGPGSQIVDEPVARKIVAFVAGTAREGQVETSAEAAASSVAEPVLLSLLCEQLNRLRLERKQERITEELVSQQGADILQRFYDESFNQFPPSEQEAIREYVAKNLVTAAGFRNPVARENACAELSALGVAKPDEAIEALIKRRLLTSERRGGTQRLELTHDKLAPLVMRARNEFIAREKELQAKKLAAEAAAREEEYRERLWRSRRQTMVFAGLLVCALVALIWGLIMRGRMKTLSQEDAEMKQQVADFKKEMDQLAATNQIKLAEFGDSAWKIFKPLWETMLSDQRFVEADLVRLKATEQFNWSAARFTNNAASTNELGEAQPIVDTTSTVFRPGKSWQLPGTITQILPANDGLLVLLAPFPIPEEDLIATTNTDSSSTNLDASTNSPAQITLVHLRFTSGPDALSGVATNQAMVLGAYPEDPAILAVADDSQFLPYLARFDSTNNTLVPLKKPAAVPGVTQNDSTPKNREGDTSERSAPLSLAFSLDGRWLAAGYEGGTLALFRVEDDFSLSKVYSRRLTNVFENVTSLAFTDGGEIILAGGNFLRSYRRIDGSFSSDDELATPFAVDPDGFDLVGLTHDHITHGNSLINRGSSHLSFSSELRPTAIAFTPQGRRLIYGLKDGSIRVDKQLESDDWEFLEVLKAHQAPVTTLCASPEGNGFFSGDGLGVLRYFKLADQPFPISEMGADSTTLGGNYVLGVEGLSHVVPYPALLMDLPAPAIDHLTGDYWRAYTATTARRNQLRLGVPVPVTNINLAAIFAPLSSFYARYRTDATNVLVFNAAKSLAFSKWINNADPFADWTAALSIPLRPQERLAFLVKTQPQWETALTPLYQANCWLNEAYGYDIRLAQWDAALSGNLYESSLTQQRTNEIQIALACMNKAVELGDTNWEDLQSGAPDLLQLPAFDRFYQSNAPTYSLLARARDFVNQDEPRATAFFDAFVAHGGVFTDFNDARNYGIILRNANRLSDADHIHELASTLATNAEEKADALITLAFTYKARNQSLLDTRKSSDPERQKVEAEIDRLSTEAVQLSPADPLIRKNISRLRPDTDLGRQAAVEDLKTALTLVSSFDRVSYTIELAGKLYELDRDEEAATNLAPILPDIDAPGTAKQYWEMISDHFRTEAQVRDASAILDNVLATYGNDLDDDVNWLYLWRGAQMRKLYHFSEAFADLDKIAERGFNPAWTLSERAETYHQFGDYQRAETDFKAAHERDPKDAWAFAKDAALSLDRGQYTNALTTAHYAFDLKKDDWLDLYLTACALAKQWTQGHAVIDPALTNQSHSADLYLTRAVFLMREAGWDTNRSVALPAEAKQLLEDAARFARKDKYPDHEQLALILIYLGRFDEADAELQLQLHDWPDDPSVFAALAALHAERGQTGDKVRALAALAEAASLQYYQGGLLQRVPAFRALREDPAYQEFLQDLKLPPGGPVERDITLAKFVRTLLDGIPDVPDGQAIRQTLNLAIDRFDSHWHDQNGYPSVYMKSQQSASPAH